MKTTRRKFLADGLAMAAAAALPATAIKAAETVFVGSDVQAGPRFVAVLQKLVGDVWHDMESKPIVGNSVSFPLPDGTTTRDVFRTVFRQEPPQPFVMHGKVFFFTPPSA